MITLDSIKRKFKLTGNPVRPQQNSKKDGIIVDDLYLKGGVFSEKTTVIDSESTHNEIPSAKSVRDYISSSGNGVYGGDGTIPTGTLASLTDGSTFAIGKWPHFPDPWFDNNDTGILIVPETQLSIFYGSGSTTGGTLEFYGSNTYWKYFGTVVSPQIDLDNTGLRLRTASANAIKLLAAGGIEINANNATPITLLQGTGSPEGVVTANIGSIYLNMSGGASTTLYIKTTGVGNTGWTAK